MAQQFFTGYKLCAVLHSAGPMDLMDVGNVYNLVFEKSQQLERMEADFARIGALHQDSHFFMVIRNQTAEREGADVRLTEYGIEGLHTPVFISEAIIWDSEKARTIKEMLEDIQHGNSGNEE